MVALGGGELLLDVNISVVPVHPREDREAERAYRERMARLEVLLGGPGSLVPPPGARDIGTA